MIFPKRFWITSVAFVTGCLCFAGALQIVAPPPPAADGTLSAAAKLGKKIFFDPALSASGRMSCATCHSPQYAYGPPNALPVQYGGPKLKTPGFRAVPSLRYVLNYVPRWSHAQATSEIERLTEPEEVPSGGYTWDGRAATVHEQALIPLFNKAEMDNSSVAALANKLSHASYAAQFRAVYGEHIFEHPLAAVTDATMALQAFQFEYKGFHPYSSKFDRWLDGKAKLTPQELRGKALFDDPNGGDCSSCHLDEVGPNGKHPLFTDFQYEAVGVPRNPHIPWNHNPHYYDLGVCGPFRTDAASKNPNNCGLFRTPSLRNVATRRVFFHNGQYHTLREVLEFYVERDSDPGKWYPRGPNGKIEKFDDLPARYRGNVDVVDAPFDNHLGGKPIWDAQQIDDVIAFLKTLDDADVAHLADSNPTSARSPHSAEANAQRASKP